MSGAAFVLGGGVAGLTAAFGLAERGRRVVLLEARRWCGGRAFSSADGRGGERLDNGPHAVLGCYRALRGLLRRLGSEGDFQQDAALALAFRRPGGVVDRLQLSRLPVPLAMPPALLRLGLPAGERLRGLLGMGAVLLGAGERATLADWLRRWRQVGGPADHLWIPLCRAIMNVEPEQASARGFLATLREAFLGSAAHAAFWLPKRPWGEILGDRAPAALAAAGVELRCGAQVRGLARGRGGIAAIELGDGGRVPVGPDDLVVAALPWFALHRVAPDLCPQAPALGSSPILSVYFDGDPAAPLPDEGPVVALVGGEPFHFVLRTPGAPAHRFALLSGGNRSLDGARVDAIVAAARQQLARYYPGVPLAAAAVRVRREHYATFVAGPGSDALRPRPGRLPGGPANLRLCGDWTATGLPATLEGAARSAEAMLAAT